MTEWLVRRFIRNSGQAAEPAVRSAYGRLASLVGIVCNVLLCAGKAAAGLAFGSVSVLADAINNLSDASSGIITLVGFRLSARPADEEHPYGHARLEYVSGLAVAVLIMAIGLELARTSIDKILHPAPVTFSLLTVAVLLASIGVKAWMAAFYGTIARRIDSSALQASSADSRNDVITTAAVLLSALLAHFANWQLDGWMGLAVACFILWSGVGIVRETINPLLGAAPSLELTQYIARKILSYDGVLGTHDLMLHDYGPGRRFGSAHVEMDASVNALVSHNIIDNIERDFLEQDNLHFVLHYDPIVVGEAAIGTTREWCAQLVRSISPKLSIHDFRMVAGPSHTNLIFDVAAPHSLALTDAELKQRIQALANEADTKYYTVVTVDRSYAPVYSEQEEMK